MIKRFLGVALCFVVIFCNVISLIVSADEERPTVYTLSIISNEMNDDCINGYMYGDETFISIDDVCTLTRSTFDIDKSKVNLYHGVMEVQLDTSENKITFWNQSTDFETKRYKGKILVKPYAILELLCARCSYIDDDKVLCVLMPSITIYEALDFDLYNKCYYNIYKGDEFNTIVRATSAFFSDVAFDGTGNFFNMLVEAFSFNGSDRYIDRALIEISDVKINEFASVENQMSQTLENRNKAVECVEKASGYSEGVGSLASTYVDILEKTIGNSDSSINIATKALSKTANIVDYLSLIKSAEEKLDYDLDSFELIGKVMTEDNIGSIEGTDYIIERADYISGTLESRLAQYLETTEQKVKEKAFEKIVKDSAKILDKGSKYPIGEISAFIMSCEIGTTITKLLMNDKFEAWDADMNAIMLSEIQNTMYDVIRNKYTDCFTDYDKAEKFVDALNLYNRTSIAMYSNLKKADEEFDIYVESFTGQFSGECDRMCEKLALNTYNLHSCNLEEDICSLEDFKKYYDNDITKNVDITEPEEQLPAIVQTVYENEKMWLDNINDLATEYSDVQFGHNECWFQDLDMDGTPEFIVGGMGLGLSEAISQVYHIYKYSNGELKQIQVNSNKFLEVTWDGKSPNYGSAGFELIQQFINNKTNSIVLTEKHKYNYTSGPAGGVISFSDYKISGTQLKSDSNYIVYCSVDGNGEITGNYRVHTQEDETDEKSFIKTYDDFFADLTPYKTTIKAVPCSDESIDMPNNYDQMTDEEKKQALLDSYNAWSYEVDIDAELPLESYIDKLRKTLSSTTENSEAETALSSACSTLCLGQGNSAAITKEGFLYTWGKNIFGNLGNGTTEDSSTPVKIMDKAKYVALGDSYSAAITDDGSLYMWGNNQYATLGDGTTKRSLIPVKIMDNVKYVVLQERYCAAITEDGSLYMWGNNQYGKLGNGTTKDSLIPVKIMDNVKTVSLSHSYCGAITEDGSLYMWGGNWCNQLGDGTTDNRLSPFKIMDNVKTVYFGSSHSAAITEDNCLYMWGYNDRGQLGDGTTKNSSIPVKIMDNVKSISLGNSHSGAITYDGTLYVWGDNGYGQLGLKTGGCLTPTKAIDNIKSINFVGDTTAAITEDNILYICGRNIEGTVADVSSVSIGRICLGGDNHYGVIKNDGYVYMWGDNGFGELGNGKQGTFEGELTPTKIEMG